MKYINRIISLLRRLIKQHRKTVPDTSYPDFYKHYSENGLRWVNYVTHLYKTGQSYPQNGKFYPENIYESYEKMNGIILERDETGSAHMAMMKDIGIKLEWSHLNHKSQFYSEWCAYTFLTSKEIILLQRYKYEHSKILMASDECIKIENLTLYEICDWGEPLDSPNGDYDNSKLQDVNFVLNYKYKLMNKGTLSLYLDKLIFSPEGLYKSYVIAFFKYKVVRLNLLKDGFYLESARGKTYLFRINFPDQKKNIYDMQKIDYEAYNDFNTYNKFLRVLSRIVNNTLDKE